ncbi:hypothetical protein [Mycobacterium colombiense]|uniref:hypothetical protein n=1 Tax=Mycobacterium colombiense TaxID=339268 RepID=UPI000AE07487|nr:hypothetical protein [Mycobacterium colombiense]
MTTTEGCMTDQTETEQRRPRRPVLGHEDAYAVDTGGNIHSLPRHVRCCQPGMEAGAGGMRLVPGRIRKPKRRYEGDRWRIRLSRDNIQTDHDLSTVVLTAWAGPAPSPDHVARHSDGNVDNNAPANLYWAVREKADRPAIRYSA